MKHLVYIGVLVLTFTEGTMSQSEISKDMVGYSFENTKKDWFSALQDCQNRNGNLATIHDEGTNSYLSEEAAAR